MSAARGVCGVCECVKHNCTSMVTVCLGWEIQISHKPNAARGYGFILGSRNRPSSEGMLLL